MRKKKELTNLEKDVIRARLMGYSSYGRYKVDYPNTKKPEEQEKELENAVQCHHCYGYFIPCRKGVRYCSNKCRERAHYLRTRCVTKPIAMV